MPGRSTSNRRAVVVAERLYRSRDERMIAGVAGGMADALDVDPTLVRIAWAVLALVTGGAAILLYFVLLFVIPEEPYDRSFAPGGGTFGTTEHPGAATTDATSVATTSSTLANPGWTSSDPRDARRAERSARREERRAARGSGTDSSRSGALILGLILVAIGVWYLIRRYLPAIDTAALWPYALVGLGILLIVVSVGRAGRRSG